jgi:hypothetical protein
MKCIIIRAATSLAVTALACASVAATVITFENLPLGGQYGPDGVWNGKDGSGGFTLNGVGFDNQFTDWGGGFTSWSGFAFSDHTDVSTPGFGNQYSASSGGGHAGSATYAVGYEAATMRFATSVDGASAGAWFTNTTYAALSMRDGDAFSKQFGGASGDDPDFLILEIHGSLAGIAGNTIDFPLADFRFADNSLDYILTEWTWLSFTPLGTFDEIRFSFRSSDVGPFGINTPAYFAMDTLVVPEPSGATMLALAALAMTSRRNRRPAA